MVLSVLTVNIECTVVETLGNQYHIVKTTWYILDHVMKHNNLSHLLYPMKPPRARCKARVKYLYGYTNATYKSQSTYMTMGALSNQITSTTAIYTTGLRERSPGI